MDGARPGAARRLQYLRTVEIGRHRRGSGDFDGGVRQAHCGSVRIDGVMHHNGLQAKALHRAHDARSDLASIRDQHRLERPVGLHLRSSSC
jgi:hypothetical protein